MDASRGSSSSSFPMPQIPALLFPPTAPPPALPSSSLSLSTYSSSSSAHHAHAPPISSFPILLLTVLGILAASALLLAYYVFVIRCCLTWHSSSDYLTVVPRRGRPRRRPQRTTTGTTGTEPEEPKGLDAAAIRALPAFSYTRRRNTNKNNAADPSPAATECAVCLGELEDGDGVRMLPACLHVFHLACVDAWLHANATCPLCRASADVHAADAHSRLLLPPQQPEDEEEVAIQVVVLVPGGAEEDDGQGALPQRQREAVVAPGGEVEGEDRHQVGGGDKTKSDAGHGVGGTVTLTERTKDGDVAPPTTRTRTSLSMDGEDAMAAGAEVHLQIYSILRRDTHHSHTHEHHSHSSSSGGARA